MNLGCDFARRLFLLLTVDYFRVYQSRIKDSRKRWRCLRRAVHSDGILICSSIAKSFELFNVALNSRIE